MAAIDRPTAYAVLGQSYGYIGHNNGLSAAPFLKLVSSAFQTDPTGITARLAGNPTIQTTSLPQMRMLATPGSSVLNKFQGSTGYWVENDGVTPGPLLTAAVTALSGYSPKATFLIWSQGEQEATAGITSADATLFKTAINTIFSSCRAACNPGSPTSVPIFLDMLGPRYQADEASEYIVGDAIIDVIAAGTNLYRGAEKYALRLDLTTHPTRDKSGYSQLGAHEGRKVNGWLLGSVPSGPSITSAVRTGNNVAVTVTVPSGKSLIKPSQPDFFGLYDGSGNSISITDYNWSGNVLTLTAASQPSTLKYPVPLRVGTGATKPTDINKVVRLASPSDPVVVGEPGLVLERAKAFTL